MSKIKFWPWFLKWYNLAIVIIYMLFTIMIIVEWGDFYDSTTAAFTLCFMQLVIVIFIVGTKKHWDRIK